MRKKIADLPANVKDYYDTVFRVEVLLYFGVGITI